MRASDYIGISEGIRSREIKLQNELSEINSKISSLQNTLDSLESELDILEMELDAALSDTDEDGNVDMRRVGAIRARMSAVSSRIGVCQSELSEQESVKLKIESELQTVKTEKQQTLSQIQSAANVKNQNLSRLSGGLSGDYASIGQNLQSAFQMSLGQLSQAASILGGSISIATNGGTGGGVSSSGQSVAKTSGNTAMVGGIGSRSPSTMPSPSAGNSVQNPLVDLSSVTPSALHSSPQNSFQAESQQIALSKKNGEGGIPVALSIRSITSTADFNPITLNTNSQIASVGGNDTVSPNGDNFNPSIAFSAVELLSTVPKTGGLNDSAITGDLTAHIIPATVEKLTSDNKPISPLDSNNKKSNSFIDSLKVTSLSHINVVPITYCMGVSVRGKISSRYQNVLEDRYNNSKPKVKRAFDRFVRKMIIQNVDYPLDYSPHYSPHSYEEHLRGVYLNSNADFFNVRGAGSTFYHELGHMLDHASTGFRNNISNSTDFMDALQKDGQRIMNAYKKMDKEKQERFISRIRQDYAHSFSDLIDAITNGELHGRFAHSRDYWKRPGNLQAEAFAHFFEASMGGDEKKYNLLTNMFQNAFRVFEEKIDSIVSEDDFRILERSR